MFGLSPFAAFQFAQAAYLMPPAQSGENLQQKPATTFSPNQEVKTLFSNANKQQTSYNDVEKPVTAY